MSRYNLLDEPWIEVISNQDGKQKEVSLLELFRHAETYKCLAGEMETQNFAVLRFLLAIVQTVFSRFDSEGAPYEFLEVDDQMRQIEDVDEDDADDYAKALEATWKRLWQAGHFPEIVCQYLEKWRDHFYLYDDKYPFFQVTEQEIKAYLPEKKPTPVGGKTINRLISESANKKNVSLFSPVAESCNKNYMETSELARWLIMAQGYIGVPDKASLVDKAKKQTTSHGWLFDLGGLYLEGATLYETLMLNYIAVHSESKHEFHKQLPCWEFSGKENVDKIINEERIDNLAQLYTNWSRAIYINPEQKKEDTKIQTVKLPAIEHQNNFLEPMTIWQYNKKGKYRDKFMPKIYQPGQAMWRSFGLISLRTSAKNHQHCPEILHHYELINQDIGNRWIGIRAVGMRPDNNKSSYMPADEIVDELLLNDLILADTSDTGWIFRINETVDMTKKIAGIYRGFLLDIAKIRNLNMDINKAGEIFVDSGTESLFQALNEPFRNWLARLTPEDSKDEKIAEWYEVLKKITEDQVQMVIRQATPRDYIGIADKDGGHMVNIVTAYQKLRRRIATKLG